jgi:uncharacterized membrane protein YdjX (TVP38/TMEM64 family)
VSRPRVVAGLIVVLVLVVAAVLAPHPGPTQIRDWARSVGPLFPLLFFVVHTLVCISPFPRTAFTVSAGLLFGPVLGVGVAVAATTASAVLALLLVRAIGRDAVAARLTHPAARAVDRRLEQRGWLAVGSLRLIAAAPFSLVNYCCGVSSVRLVPYVLATVVGILPGTIAVVVVGNALTGHLNLGMLLFTVACCALGLGGLGIDLFLAVRKTGERSDTP